MRAAEGFVVAIVLTVGCGSDEASGLGGDAGAPSAGGGTSSGGAGGSLPPGGAAGSQATGGSTPAGPCASHEATLSVDGQPLQRYTLSQLPDGTHGSGTGFSFDGPIGDAGWFILSGSDPVNQLMGLPYSLSEGQTISISRSFLAPDASDTALGTMLCTGAGSGSTLTRRGNQLLLDLERVTTGTCAEHPIQGEINLCADFAGCGAAFDGGSVTGTAWTSQPVDYAAGVYDFQAGLGGDAVYLKGKFTGPNVAWAIVLTRPNGPFGGEVLCAVGGARTTLPGTAYEVWQLRNLGSFGTCTGGGASAAGCLQGR